MTLVVAGCGTDPTPTPTPTATPSEEATSTPAPAGFEQEWNDLIEAAQAEGEIVIAAGGSASRTFQPIWDEFSEKFGVNVVVSRGSGSENYERLRAEREAGRHTLDVLAGGATSLNTRMRPAGMLAEMEPLLFHPEVVDRSNWYGDKLWFTDEDSKYIIAFSAALEPTPLRLHYNTNLVSEEDIASIDSVWDYLEPRFHGGKIIGFPPDSTGAGVTMFSTYVHPEMGPDYIRKYVMETQPVLTDDVRFLTDQMALGGAEISFFSGTGGNVMDDMIEEGSPIARFDGPVEERAVLSGSSSANNFAVVNPPANPNATKLYVNWFLSREGQSLVHQIPGEPPDPPLRRDVEPYDDSFAWDFNVDYPHPEADPDIKAQEPEIRAFIESLMEEYRATQ